MSHPARDSICQKRQTFRFQNVGKLADLRQQFTVGDLTAVIRVVTFPVKITHQYHNALLLLICLSRSSTYQTIKQNKQT